MLRKFLALIFATLMAALELALGRLDRDQFIEYIQYLLAVATGGELYLDIDQRLDGQPGGPNLTGGSE